MEARPHGLLSGLGPPSQLADEGPDEDSLNREGGPDIGEGSDDLLDNLYRGLKGGHREVIEFTGMLGHALVEMAHAAANDNKDLLDHWFEGATRAIACLGEDDGE